jgi:uncharacterized protein YndB with AHSA1/START domain
MNDTIAPLTVQHVYSAPPARVFEGWVDPSLASRWLFATPDGRIVRCDIDPRPGGALVITDRRAGDEVEHRGIVEVDPRRLIFTFSVPKCIGVVTTSRSRSCRRDGVRADARPRGRSAGVGQPDGTGLGRPA